MCQLCIATISSLELKQGHLNRGLRILRIVFKTINSSSACLIQLLSVSDEILHKTTLSAKVYFTWAICQVMSPTLPTNQQHVNQNLVTKSDQTTFLFLFLLTTLTLLKNKNQNTFPVCSEHGPRWCSHMFCPSQCRCPHSQRAPQIIREDQ